MLMIHLWARARLIEGKRTVVVDTANLAEGLLTRQLRFGIDSIIFDLVVLDFKNIMLLI